MMTTEQALSEIQRWCKNEPTPYKKEIDLIDKGEVRGESPLQIAFALYVQEGPDVFDYLPLGTKPSPLPEFPCAEKR